MTSLALEIYGAFVNVLLVDGAIPGGRLLARLRDDRRAGTGARLERGGEYHWPHRDRIDPLLDGAAALAARLAGSAAPDDPAGWAARLATSSEGLSPVTAAAVVARADRPITADRLAEAVVQAFADAAQRPEPGLLVSGGRARALPLRPAPGAGSWEPASSMAGALNRLARLLETPGMAVTGAAGVRPAAQQRLTQRLNDRLRTARRRLERLRAEIDRHPDEETPRRQAETLLAAADRVPRGASQVELPAPDGGENLVIPLDPARSAVENAERLFREARKARQSRERLPVEIRGAERDLARLEEWTDRLAGLDPADREGFDQFAFEIDGRPRGGRADRGAGANQDGPGAVRSPTRRGSLDGAPASFRPRRYDLPGGWQALVGRSEAGNDFLTHRLADPHDLWFHAHGCPGSHVVLKGPDRVAQPDKGLIETAAALAALHSRARHAAKVPVIYAEKRHVRKPRGSKPGLAAVTHEKSIMVKPAEPGSPREDA